MQGVTTTIAVTSTTAIWISLTAQLHQDLALGEEAETREAKTLVLLDFNGLLAYRDNKGRGVPGLDHVAQTLTSPMASTKTFPVRSTYVRGLGSSCVRCCTTPDARLRCTPQSMRRMLEPSSKASTRTSMSDAGDFEPVTVCGSAISTASAIMDNSIGSGCSTGFRLYNSSDTQARTRRLLQLLCSRA